MSPPISPARTYETTEELLKLADKLVIERMRDQFPQDDIAVVTSRGMRSTAFRERHKIGNVPVRRFTGSYDAKGRRPIAPRILRSDC